MSPLPVCLSPQKENRKLGWSSETEQKLWSTELAPEGPPPAAPTVPGPLWPPQDRNSSDICPGRTEPVGGMAGDCCPCSMLGSGRDPLGVPTAATDQVDIQGHAFSDHSLQDSPAWASSGSGALTQPGTGGQFLSTAEPGGRPARYYPTALREAD